MRCARTHSSVRRSVCRGPDMAAGSASTSILFAGPPVFMSHVAAGPQTCSDLWLLSGFRGLSAGPHPGPHTAAPLGHPPAAPTQLPFKLRLTMHHKQGSNLQSSCLRLWSAGITGLYHHTWLSVSSDTRLLLLSHEALGAGLRAWAYLKVSTRSQAVPSSLLLPTAGS